MSQNRTCAVEFIEKIKVGLENANNRVSLAETENRMLVKKIEPLELKARKLRIEVSTLENQRQMNAVATKKSHSNSSNNRKNRKRIKTQKWMFGRIGISAVVLVSFGMLRYLRSR